jgi:4-amino-4-deoxy-L-arabinose transferase-like glycosyltransferase
MEPNKLNNPLTIFRNAFGYLLPTGYFILVILFYPFRFVLEFDPDEGNILILANQITEGFSLYSDVWNDHPPLIPQFLAVLFQIFGMNVTIARLFILLLSCILIWALIMYLHKFWGSSHALVGVLLVILLPYYTRLSISVMIGLPSLVFAVISFVSLSFWHRRKSTIHLIISALFLGTSVLIKLQTVFLAIIFIIGLLISEFRQRGERAIWIKGIKPALTWSLGFLSFIVMLGIPLIGSEGIPQLLGTHLTARGTEALQTWSGDIQIAQSMEKSWPIFVLALVGSFHTIKARSFTATYLIAWILVGYVLLTQLQPIWYHHQLLLTIPACMLASITVGEGLRQLRQLRTLRVMTLRNSFPVAISLFGLAAYLYLRLPPSISEYRFDLPNFHPPSTPATPRQEMLAMISDYADETTLMITDRPMYAFRTGIAVPPELAVFSGKRFLTGSLTEKDIIRVIRSTNPEQVALTRFSMPDVSAYLADNYQLTFIYRNNQLFIRNDLLTK